MKSTRRQFIQAAGTTGAALLTLQTASADDTAAPAVDRPTFTTELFLDNHIPSAGRATPTWASSWVRKFGSSST